MARFPPAPQRKRDLELCKVLFGAALSQILYARRSFAPSMFQVIPKNDLTLGFRFEDIVATGSRIDRWDRELMRDEDNVLFLRQDDNNFELTELLNILTTDIFSLLEKEQLVKFRVSFLRSPTLSEASLVEYYTFAIKYPPTGKYGIDIWRSGTGDHHISTTANRLWNLGDYLSRLPPLTDPIYCTLAFHACERPDEPAIGRWRFNHDPFETAKLRLQQRDGYSFQRIANLLISPIPLSAIDREPIAESAADEEHEYARQETEATDAATAGEISAEERPPEESDSDPEEIPPVEVVTLSAVLEEANHEEAHPEDDDPKEADLGQYVVKKAPINARVYRPRPPRGVSPPQLQAERPQETRPQEAQEARPQETPAEPSSPPRKPTKTRAKKAPNPKPRVEPKPRAEPKPRTEPKPRAEPKPKSKPKAKPKGAKPPAKKGRKANTKGKAKSSPAKTPDEATDDAQPSAKKIATKRKPKPPLELDPPPQLQIYEEVNSNMSETQLADRLSQLQSQKTQGTHKRNGDDELLGSPRAKRLRSSPQQSNTLAPTGTPRPNSPALNDPTSLGVLSPEETQSQNVEPLVPPTMPDLDDDNRPYVGGLFDDVRSESARPSHPAKAIARKPSLFDDDDLPTSSGDEDDDDEAADDVGPEATLFGPKSGLEGTDLEEEARGQRVVGAQSIFGGVGASDDEDE